MRDPRLLMSAIIFQRAITPPDIGPGNNQGIMDMMGNLPVLLANGLQSYSHY